MSSEPPRAKKAVLYVGNLGDQCTECYQSGFVRFTPDHQRYQFIIVESYTSRDEDRLLTPALGKGFDYWLDCGKSGYIM